MAALLAVIRSKILVLITWTLLGAAVAGGINMMLPVVYEANAKILIAAPYWNDSTALADPNVGGGKTLAYGDEFTQQRMASYARLVTTSLVTSRVAEQLRLGESGDQLATKVSGHMVPDTVMLQVRAEDSSPARAASIADATALRTIEVIKEVERPPFSVVSPVQPVLFEPASVPSRPISPRTLLNIFCGAIVGFLLGLTYAAAYGAVRESRRLERLRGVEDTFSGELNAPLGVLDASESAPRVELDNDAKLLRLAVTDRLTESSLHSVVLTSPRGSPATTGVAAVLAAALAEAGSPTVVVCADFSAAEDPERVGLGDLLCTRMPLDAVLLTDERTGVSWIPPGNAPENPTREITGAKMHNLLIELSSRYTYIVVVGAPALELADAVDLTSLFGASILVDLVSQTTLRELRESERLLGLARGAYLGRVAVAGRAFSDYALVPQFGDLAQAAGSGSSGGNGERWSY